MASILDIAIALEIDSLFQMTLVHLCETLLPLNQNLLNFDHCFMEFVFEYADRKNWKQFGDKVTEKMARRFEDLLNFSQIEILPARVFAKLMESDNLSVDEEYQAISTINQYVRFVEAYLQKKYKDDELYIQPQLDTLS